VKTKVTLLAAPAVAAPIAVMPVVTPRAANIAAVFFLALGVENMYSSPFSADERGVRHNAGTYRSKLALKRVVMLFVSIRVEIS
jgi:hypothetical protein